MRGKHIGLSLVERHREMLEAFLRHGDERVVSVIIARSRSEGAVIVVGH